MFGVGPGDAPKEGSGGGAAPMRRMSSMMASSTTFNAANRKGFADEEEELVDSMWGPFTERTDDGSITINDLEHICEDIGIECDLDMLKRVIKPEDHEAIYFQDAVQAVMGALRFTHDDMFDEDADDLTGAVALSPLDYFRWKRGSLELDPERDYYLSWALCCTAKNVLVLSTLVVFTLVAASVITFSSITWLNGALEREKEMLRNFQNALYLFSSGLEDRLLLAHQDSILDSANTVARWNEFMWRRERADIPMHLERELRVFTAINDKHMKKHQDSSQRAMRTLDSLRKLLDHAQSSASPMTVKAAIERHLTHPWQVSINSTSMGLQVVPFDDAAMNNLCTYPTDANGALLPGPTLYTDPSSTAQGVTVVLGNAGLKVCVVQSDADALEETREDSIRTINAADKLDTHSTKIWTATPFASLWAPGTLSPPRAALNATGVNFTNLFTADTPTPIMAPWTMKAVAMLRRSMSLPTGIPTDFMQTLRTIYDERNTSVTAGEVNVYGEKQPFHFVATYDAANRGVLVVMVSRQILVRDFRKKLITTVEDMNWQFVRTTEVVIADFEEGTEKLLPQATSFRFFSGCYGECFRFLESAQTAIDAVQNKGSGGYIAPDYRPEPVVSLYAYMTDGIDVPVIVERDVRDLRSVILNTMIDIVNQINKMGREGQEVQLIRYADLPNMPFFDPMDECPAEVFCLTRPGDHSGVLFRTDCADCERAPALSKNASIAFITDLIFTNKCGGGCQSNPQRDEPSLARTSVDSQSYEGEQPDYTGEQVLATSQYFNGLSTALLVKVYERGLVDPIIQSITISAVIAALLSIVGLIIVMYATTRVLKRIDDEWQENKAALEVERQRFVRYTDFLVPRHVIRKVRSGHSVVADPSPLANVMSIDAVSFSDFSKGWPNGQVIRFMSYYHYVLDEALSLRGIYKLKAFGDCVVAVNSFGKLKLDQFARNNEDKADKTGGGDNNNSETSSTVNQSTTVGSRSDLTLRSQYMQQSPVENMLECAIMLVRLFSRNFAHLPTYRTKKKSRKHMTGDDIVGSVATDTQCTKESTRQALNMPTLRIGIASGSIVSGYINVGKTPRFDCYGPTMLLASRMQHTCPANAIHVTASFKDEYVSAIQGKINEVTFDLPRKTIVKGRSTVISYLVKNTGISVPEAFSARLGIQHSHQKHLFPSDERRKGGSQSRSQSSRSTLSKRSGSSAASFISSSSRNLK